MDGKFVNEDPSANLSVLNKDTSENEEDEGKKSCCPNMSPYLLMLALSVHSVFEGLALGLAKTETSCMNMTIAILAHKGTAALSLGISLVKAFPNEMGFIRWLITIFNIATPLGVVIGMIVSNAGDIYCVVFSSIAAGTFLYIACTEIIVQEFAVGDQRWWKLLFYMIGATFITCLWFVEKPEDDE